MQEHIAFLGITPGGFLVCLDMLYMIHEFPPDGGYNAWSR